MAQQVTELPAPEYEHRSTTVPDAFLSLAVSPSLFQMYPSLRQ